MLGFAYTILTNEQPEPAQLKKIEPKKIDIPRYRAFTHSSSFVGNVRYDRDMQRMTAILSGKEYTFCNVPERKFDAFEGANSKGAYFNREIKSLHDC